jgi:hypothetical protein
MYAVVRTHRIDISGIDNLPPISWETMLNELKAEPIPGQTPFGDRMLVASNSIVIFRINDLLEMPDVEVIKILEKYGIAAYAEGDLAKGASG